MHFRQDVLLAPLTTMGVGGPARYLVDVHSPDEIPEAFAFAASHCLPVFILGGGSNLIVSDRGWPGLVVRIQLGGLEIQKSGDTTLFVAGAGEDWDVLVARSVQEDCAGIECLSGIPGSVGATPIQNVGAYGQEVSQRIASVTVLDRAEGDIKHLDAKACGFAYRTSIFNTTHRNRYVILQVSFALTPGGVPTLEYADLRRHFAGASSPPTLSQARDAVLQLRASKSMLIRPGDEDARSAGSFFKNPLVAGEALQQLLQRAEARGEHIPMFPAQGETTKASAAWLVEHSGFPKGFDDGRVGISRKHALAIVNRGGATAADILELQQRIRIQVQQTWGVVLEPEPDFVGF